MLEQFGKDYRDFIETDPYNPQNVVEGSLCIKQNDFYGALFIKKVNGKACEQLIYGTPKIRYPFVARADGTRNYLFPTVKGIEIYEKLDGTNVLAYSYTDGKYNYVTYKTRLKPFLSSSKWGDFSDLWNEVTKDWQRSIKATMVTNNCNLSFELYGSRNLHLIRYDEPLAFALLFGIKKAGGVIPLSALQTDIPTAPMVATISKDYVWNYEQTQQELESGLKPGLDNTFYGKEGTVWYLNFFDGKSIPVKCKPETVENICFASGLNEPIIKAAVMKAAENDDLTEGAVILLLCEDFDPITVNSKINTIHKCIEEVKAHLVFKDKVLLELTRLNLELGMDKVSMLRALSPAFNRTEMGSVYSILKDEGYF